MGGNLSKQQQMIVMAIALVAFGVYGYYTYLMKPLFATIATREKQYSDLIAKIETAERQARRLPALQAEFAQLQGDLSNLEKQLPKDKDLPNIIRTLTREALQEDMKFIRLAPKPVQRQQYFEIIPFDIQFNGSLHNLARFLASLGQQDRIFQAENISLSPAGTSDVGEQKLSISLTLQTYAYAG